MTEQPETDVPKRTRQERRGGAASPPRQSSRRFGLILAAACVALVLAAAAVLLPSGRHPGGTGAASDPPATGGPFTLVDGNGKQVTDRDLRGKYLLVYFGYTFCPDVCPTTLNEISAAVDRLGPKAERVQPVFITVDPRRDTPDTVKRYTEQFSPRILGLTGTPEQVAAVSREYRVYAAVHRTGDGPDDYTGDHSSVLYLMGPDGRFITRVPADKTGAEIAAALAGHIS